VLCITVFKNQSQILTKSRSIFTDRQVDVAKFAKATIIYQTVEAGCIIHYSIITIA